MAQKIMAKKLIEGDHDALLKQQSVIAAVDGGYSHEFTSARVHQFLRQEYGVIILLKTPRALRHLRII